MSELQAVFGHLFPGLEQMDQSSNPNKRPKPDPETQPQPRPKGKGKGKAGKGKGKARLLGHTVHGHRQHSVCPSETVPAARGRVDRAALGSSCTGSSGSVGRLADSPFPVASLCFPVQQKRY